VGLVTGYPGMLLATGGTVCLVLVVVTSVKAARRRIRYESWHLLHLYAYLGVGLALPHQLWTGQQFMSSPARTVFWWTAWGVAAAAVLLFRVGLPLRVNLRHRLRVTSVVREAGGVASVYLTGRRLDRLDVEAGQFLSWRFLGRRGWTRANPYSLSAAPDGRSLRITVQAVGDGSAGLFQRAARHPGAGGGPVRTPQRPRPHPAQGRPDRRGGRHHAAAGARRGAGLRTR
jgi:predicted ferric reductase